MSQSLTRGRAAGDHEISLMGRTGIALALGVGLAVLSPAQTPPPRDLTQFSLEDLMNVQVTSVSKKEQKVAKTGAAIFVITQEDIRRSGASTIPEVLRMVPGIDVAQIDANTTAISIRGFNDRLANKVLVLIDGRTVYTPTTSGVYWDQQDVPLEDIERIEVIRGPGGTVWGANAVNGVINIITMSAKSTTGGLIAAGGGSQQTARGLAQYGATVGQTGAYRVFGDYSNTGSLTASDGSRAADGWHMFHGGFRSDWNISPSDSLTVQGDLMNTGEGQTIAVTFANALPLQRTFNDSVTVDSGNILGRWDHLSPSGSDTSLQVYFDRYERHDEGVTETLNTLDLDFHKHFAAGSRNDIVWGAGYRMTSDDHLPGYGKTYVPLSRTNSLFTAFFQDEIRLMNNLWFTLGSKLEHSAYSGLQYEPSAQLVWTVTARSTLWLSAARAIVQTSREESDLRIDVSTFPVPGGTFGLLQLTGNPNLKPEELRDFEVGYRAQVFPHFAVDIATFASFYRHSATTTAGIPFFTTSEGPPHLVIPLVFSDIGSAQTYGAEVFANWNVTRRWRIAPGVSGIHLTAHDPSTQPNLLEKADSTPELQAQVRSVVNVTRNVDWDATLSHTGHLRDGGDGPVPAYTRLDTRLEWRFGEGLSLSLVGQNLLTPRHAEFHNAYELRRTLVERSAFAKITWRF